MSNARKYAEAIVIRWWEGVSTADEWESDVREIEADIERAIAEERGACANIVQERAHHHGGCAIRCDRDGVGDLAEEHRQCSAALLRAEEEIRKRGQRS